MPDQNQKRYENALPVQTDGGVIGDRDLEVPRDAMGQSRDPRRERDPGRRSGEPGSVSKEGFQKDVERAYTRSETGGVLLPPARPEGGTYGDDKRNLTEQPPGRVLVAQHGPIKPGDLDGQVASLEDDGTMTVVSQVEKSAMEAKKLEELDGREGSPGIPGPVDPASHPAGPTGSVMAEPGDIGGQPAPTQPTPMQINPAQVLEVVQFLMATNEYFGNALRNLIGERKPEANLPVSFIGPFGKANLRAIKQIMSPPTIVLVLPDRELAFEPPISGEQPSAFTLKIGEAEYPVLYHGINFEHEGLFFMIFIMGGRA